MRDQIRQQIEILKRVSSGIPREPLAQAAVDHVIGNLEAAIAPQWVPVGERLPDTPRSVFVIDCNEDGYSIGYYLAGYGWGGCDINEENVTHWHPIDYPEPPQEQQQ